MGIISTAQDVLPFVNLALIVLVLVVLAYPRMALRGKSVQPSNHPLHLLPPPVESLPEGHQWPQKFDEFDGVMERFVCRDCGQSFLRRRI